MFKLKKVSLNYLLITILLAIFSNKSYAESSACGSLKINGSGPFDYRNERDELAKVEGAHFTDVVEALIKGTTNILPGGDIAFTLAVYPNNHRALIAMVKLGEKERNLKPTGSRYTIDCWFDRALRFRPDDSVVRMIYSSYLDTKGRRMEAGEQLNAAATYARDSGITHYNIGLHYLKIDNYEKALIHAHQAIAYGWQNTVLKDKLQILGKWRDPEPTRSKEK